MKSHEYKTTVGDWIKAVLPTLVALVGLAWILRTANGLSFLPVPPVFANPGSTVLAHQAAAAKAGLPGEIVLLGDSTCMMGVDALTLEANLPGHGSVLNLGLIVWLGFEDYAGLLSNHSAVTPTRIKTVVLLVTPTKLTLKREDGMGEAWRNLRVQEKASTPKLTSWRTVKAGLGCDILRRNLLSHWMVRPLAGKGDGTIFFGFPNEIDNYMTTHQGSLIELGAFKQSRQQESWSLTPSPDLAAQCKTLREAVPVGAKLIIGLTPMPESRSSIEERERRPVLLQIWNQHINADGVLTNLPPVMPDIFFASGGHLNLLGQKKFTAILARELSPFLEKEKR